MIAGKKKLKEVERFMERNKIKYILFPSPQTNFDVNVRYFTGFKKEFGSCFLILEGKKRILITGNDGFALRKKFDYEEVFNLQDYGFDLTKLLKRNFEKGCKVGVIKSRISLKLYEELRRRMKWKFVDVTRFINELRAVKEEGEVRLIKRACRITNSGIKFLSELLEEWKNLKDVEVRKMLEDFLKTKGIERMAFETLVASGKTSSLIHPPLFNKPLKKGLGYVDFGVVYKGYCSDVTVPFSLGGLKERERKIVETVKDVYSRVLEMIEEGVESVKVFQTANEFLKDKGFELPHGLGHGLGMDVHDPPFFSPKKEASMPLQNNMVFTIEPAIYAELGGCRLENDFLLKNGKIKQLTCSDFLEF